MPKMRALSQSMAYHSGGWISPCTAGMNCAAGRPTMRAVNASSYHKESNMRGMRMIAPAITIHSSQCGRMAQSRAASMRGCSHGQRRMRQPATSSTSVSTHRYR